MINSFYIRVFEVANMLTVTACTSCLQESIDVYLLFTDNFIDIYRPNKYYVDWEQLVLLVRVQKYAHA